MKKGMAFLLTLVLLLFSGCRAIRADSDTQSKAEAGETPAATTEAITQEPGDAGGEGPGSEPETNEAVPTEPADMTQTAEPKPVGSEPTAPGPADETTPPAEEPSAGSTETGSPDHSDENEASMMTDF